MSKNNTKDQSSIVQEVSNKSPDKLKIKTTDDNDKCDIEDKQKQDVILIGIATKYPLGYFNFWGNVVHEQFLEWHENL